MVMLVIKNFNWKTRIMKLRLTYLLLIEHPSKVAIARMLVERSSSARQHIVIIRPNCHFIDFFIHRKLKLGLAWLSRMKREDDSNGSAVANVVFEVAMENVVAMMWGQEEYYWLLLCTI